MHKVDWELGVKKFQEASANVGPARSPVSRPKNLVSGNGVGT